MRIRAQAFLLTILILVLVSPSWAMENYTEVLRDQYGRAIGGATVVVYQAGTQTPATLYSDNGVTQTTNPLVTEMLTGQFNFYAANGVYDIQYFSPGATFDPDKSRRIALFDINDYSQAGGNSNSPIASGPVFPSSPLVNYQFFLTSDGTGGACQEGVGTTVTLCRYNGSDWDPVSSSSVTGWPTVSTTKEITWANSVLNAVRIGDGTTPMCHYTDATLGPVIRPCTDSNVRTLVPANFTWCWYDLEAAACAFTFDPDAATPKDMYQFSAGYRPLKTVWFGAGSLSTDGAQCANPAEVTINSGPKIWTIICTDNDASTIYGSIKMPNAWDGGTLIFIHSYIQTASNTAALHGDIAAQCRGNGEAVSSTWGTEVPIDDAGVTGSNQNDFTASADVTPAGTCVGGDMLYWRYQLDATGTTTAVATLHHVGFAMKYALTSLSD